MASIVVSGDTSGAITLQAPAVAGSTTLTLPTANGTVLTTANTFAAGTGPAFSAYFVGTQSVTSNVITKVTLNTEYFDTNNNFDSTTNYRFTPTVAGYYQFSYGVVGVANSTTMQTTNVLIYKNGAEPVTAYSTGSYLYPTAVENASATGAFLLYMNGSTDYVELYGKVIGTNPRVSAAYLNGCLVRGA